MIGAISQHSDSFLRVTAVLVTIAFSIPIALAPLAWARAFRWRVDGQQHLATYFGRCLGVVALALSWAAWHAAEHPELQPFYFKLLIGIAVLMTIVHIAGALQKVQPWTETAEIPLWGGLALLGLIFYPIAHT